MRFEFRSVNCNRLDLIYIFDNCKGWRTGQPLPLRDASVFPVLRKHILRRDYETIFILGLYGRGWTELAIHYVQPRTLFFTIPWPYIFYISTMQWPGIRLRNNQGSLGNIHRSSFPEGLLHDKGHRGMGQIDPAIQFIQSNLSPSDTRITYCLGL